MKIKYEGYEVEGEPEEIRRLIEGKTAIVSITKPKVLEPEFSICKNCGRSFKPKRKNSKVCSVECSKEYWYKLNGKKAREARKAGKPKKDMKGHRRKKVRTKCVQCGKGYNGILNKQKFCCDKCRWTYNNNRLRAKTAGNPVILPPKKVEAIPFPNIISVRKDLQPVLKQMVEHMIKNNTSMRYSETAYTLALGKISEWREFINEFILNSNKISAHFKVKNYFKIEREGGLAGGRSYIVYGYIPKEVDY